MILDSIGCIQLLGFLLFLVELLCSMVHLRFSLWVVSCKIAVPETLWVFASWHRFGHQGMACGCSPPWFASLLVTPLCYLGAHYGFSLFRVGVGCALRVSPVVTRLTVYRRPQVMRPGRNWATKEQTYLWQTGSSSDTCSGSSRHI